MTRLLMRMRDAAGLAAAGVATGAAAAGIAAGLAAAALVLDGGLSPALAAQGQSDIYVADIQRSVQVAPGGRPGGSRSLSLGAHTNVTRRAGYDNQPHFIRDGSAILYTRIDDSGQADIWRYDIASATSHAVTRTSPESEYSATPFAAGGFTVIRVERDSTQRLWHFADDGSNPVVVFEDVKPVGYHAWVDDVQVAMFILGQPATLQLGDTRTGTARLIASGIGRSIQKVPGRRAISFLHVLPPPEGEPAAAGWMLKLLDVETGMITELAAPPYYVDAAAVTSAGDTGIVAAPRGTDPRTVVRAAEYHAWLPDGTLITAAGSRLQAWNAGTESWTVVADVASDGLLISRLAVSPDGARLAFVAEPAAR